MEGSDSAANTAPQKTLLAELEAYAARYPAEAATAERLAAFVRGHSDAFLRSCLEGHVTGSAFVVDEGMERTLLVHHVKLGKWLQSGGHCEPGETAEDAARREAEEETGLRMAGRIGSGLFDIDAHAIPERAGVREHVHYDARYLFIAEPGEPEASEESHAVEWVTLDEAARRNPEESIQRPIAKLREIARLP